MKLSEIIAAIGDENVQIQNLDECLINADYSLKSGTKITFGTSAIVTITGTEKLGLIVWLPRDAAKKALGR